MSRTVTRNLILLCFSLSFFIPSALAQYGWGNSGNIGANNLNLDADNKVAANPGTGGGTGPTVKARTQLTIGLGVFGVSPGSAYAVCWSNYTGHQVQIFSIQTTKNLTPVVFHWTPTQSGSYLLYCSAQWTFPNGGGGVATTGIITVPVN